MESVIDKRMSLEQAAARVSSGSSLSVGGFTSQRHPTALLRALVSRGVKELVLYCHSGGSDIDLLIGAGCVKRLEAAYLADGVFSPVAPNWRRLVEEGRIEFEDYSNAAMMARFAAGAMGLPFLPTRSLLGSDLLTRWGISEALRRGDSTLAPKKAVVAECPFTGETICLVPAIRTDFCLLHVQKASPQGLLRIEGQEFLDVQQALAARSVIATCEELVEDEDLRREPERNRIPPFAVQAVVHLPWGAHPHSVHNCYDYDPEHLGVLARAARSAETFQAYLDRYVFGVPDHDAYLEAVGGEFRLSQLRARSGLGYNPELKRKNGKRSHPP
jgi:glutaconate CoA-transferase subunit A